MHGYELLLLPVTNRSRAGATWLQIAAASPIRLPVWLGDELDEIRKPCDGYPRDKMYGVWCPVRAGVEPAGEAPRLQRAVFMHCGPGRRYTPRFEACHEKGQGTGRRGTRRLL